MRRSVAAVAAALIAAVLLLLAASCSSSTSDETQTDDPDVTNSAATTTDTNTTDSENAAASATNGSDSDSDVDSASTDGESGATEGESGAASGESGEPVEPTLDTPETNDPDDADPDSTSPSEKDSEGDSSGAADSNGSSADSDHTASSGDTTAPGNTDTDKPGNTDTPENTDNNGKADADAGATSDEPEVKTPEIVESTAREDVPSALRDRDNSAHPTPLINLQEIRSGGPPPDGIPPLENPGFESVDSVDWLASREPVLALEINGDARAYPLQIMTWHELVNGTVGGVPVTVSYCPLCNSAVAYDRRVGDRILDFGTSGELYNSALVMYDRQTESLWSHFTGQAVAGHLTGTVLDFFPVQTVSFGTFAEAYPQGVVLSIDTGFSRSYGRNPYEGYDNPDRRPFLFSGEIDERLAPKARVLAVRADGGGVVIPYELLVEQSVVSFTAGGRNLIALHQPGTASALDTDEISEGRDIGATGVFVRPSGSFDLQPNANGSGFVDSSSGVVYNILGAPTGQTGMKLESVEHLDTFWFAAAAFDPNVRIITQ